MVCGIGRIQPNFDVSVMVLKRTTVCFILVWGMFFSGCGYHFAGGGSFPAGIKSISINMLENRTAETGVENVFTNDIIYEITRDKKVLLTSEDKADAALSGTIVSMRSGTISRTGQYTSIERRVFVTVDLKLTHRDGRIIWTAKGLSANEEYVVASDKQATEQNRRDAISELSKRLAERIYNRLTEDF